MAAVRPSAGPPPRVGRPRSEAARRAVLTAAADLLVREGLGAVSMDAVAGRAGVSKATIYRWWPTKESLALDVLFEEWAGSQRPVTDTGSLRGDLVALLRPWSRTLTRRPYAKVVAALIAQARTDPAFAQEYLDRFVQPRRDAGRVVVRRAVDRGEVAPDVPVEVVLDLLYGAVYHRFLHGHAPLTDRYVDQVVDLAATALRVVEGTPGIRPGRGRG
jgi:AcrR family transcriptional regulator